MPKFMLTASTVSTYYLVVDAPNRDAVEKFYEKNPDVNFHKDQEDKGWELTDIYDYGPEHGNADVFVDEEGNITPPIICMANLKGIKKLALVDPNTFHNEVLGMPYCPTEDEILEADAKAWAERTGKPWDMYPKVKERDQEMQRIFMEKARASEKLKVDPTPMRELIRGPEKGEDDDSSKG